MVSPDGHPSSEGRLGSQVPLVRERHFPLERRTGNNNQQFDMLLCAVLAALNWTTSRQYVQ